MNLGRGLCFGRRFGLLRRFGVLRRFRFLRPRNQRDRNYYAKRHSQRDSPTSYLLHPASLVLPHFSVPERVPSGVEGCLRGETAFETRSCFIAPGRPVLLPVSPSPSYKNPRHSPADLPSTGDSLSSTGTASIRSRSG